MIVFDTETTDLVNPEASKLSMQPKIIEFAAIKLDDETLQETDRMEFLANPGEPLRPLITKITGLTDKDLADQKPFSANYRELVLFFLGEKTMLAHNVAFDRNLLKFELMRMDKVLQFPWPPQHKCSIQLTEHINGYRLNLGKFYQLVHGTEFKDAHRAMADTEALASCMPWLREKGLL